MNTFSITDIYHILVKDDTRFSFYSLEVFGLKEKN